MQYDNKEFVDYSEYFAYRLAKESSEYQEYQLESLKKNIETSKMIRKKIDNCVKKVIKLKK